MNQIDAAPMQARKVQAWVTIGGSGDAAASIRPASKLRKRRKGTSQRSRRSSPSVAVVAVIRISLEFLFFACTFGATGVCGCPPRSARGIAKCDPANRRGVDGQWAFQHDQDVPSEHAAGRRCTDLRGDHLIPINEFPIRALAAFWRSGVWNWQIGTWTKTFARSEKETREVDASAARPRSETSASIPKASTDMVDALAKMGFVAAIPPLSAPPVRQETAARHAATTSNSGPEKAASAQHSTG